MLNFLLIFLYKGRSFQHTVIFKETKSRVASARSNGALLVSATEPIKKIMKAGNKGSINHIGF